MPAAWGPYPDTVLHFPRLGCRIDLRQPVTAEARRILASAGLDRPFAVITAADPLGRPLGPAANRRLTALLTTVVRLRHPGALDAHGESLDRSHVEPGLAIPLPLQEARLLAARFFQNALFWYDGDRFFIVPVLAAGEILPLPAERERSNRDAE